MRPTLKNRSLSDSTDSLHETFCSCYQFVSNNPQRRLLWLKSPRCFSRLTETVYLYIVIFLCSTGQQSSDKTGGISLTVNLLDASCQFVEGKIPEPRLCVSHYRDEYRQCTKQKAMISARVGLFLPDSYRMKRDGIGALFWDLSVPHIRLSSVYQTKNGQDSSQLPIFIESYQKDS